MTVNIEASQFIKTQKLKGELFKRLHANGVPFVMPNPWDRGTAILMEKAGFIALGTTSAGLAFSLGKLDRTAAVTLEETLENASQIVSVTDLPLSVDLEDGFASDADGIISNIMAAAATGAVGCSIEDYSGDEQQPIRDFSTSLMRVEAAVEAARRLPFPFTLTARAENFLYGIHDLQDTIARLKAFEKAGADVVYAPALPDAESIKTVCRAVNVPVNVLLGAGNRLTVSELFALGVTRVSLGSALSRAALGGCFSALQELQQNGSCTFLDRSVGYFDVAKLLTKGKL
ncbi:2-methylisocitrate lyase [Lonsdalea britannica]|uniref:Isocitrate lyase/phosphoenolpyruvate mutase family protein n=1 Tax=Lonsdalea britannica TaxID=1082704 RepID=A0AAD0SI38_9GAMM|nr:isocitrate lyase/phosphoenolpyruvate mutase family protein [Lonsdalea britannica]AXW85673.1 isocitrate lyase/phosphoenolpyruvate mutase family protein [Lonsdalea britannica]OSM96507.1 2-methylisocitrate lyase [Lonsdalea britannica]